MKPINSLFLGSFLFFQSLFSQTFVEKSVHIAIQKDSIYGTLLQPKTNEKKLVAILIPGSGPTDRNGNQGMLQNNSLKYLAEALSEKGMATYRFDQSVISQSKFLGFKEENYSFSELVTEVKIITAYLKNQYKFSKIVLIGHSQGSLVGMLAVSDEVDAYISLCGSGQSIDVLLKEQLVQQVPQLEESYTKTLNQLKNGETVTDVNPMLYSLFRPSVQPFLRDWMQYNPSEILSKLQIPILIIGGTKDIQVSDNEANILFKSNPKSKLVIIDNMNHIFKEIKGPLSENQMSYMNPSLPIMPQLVNEIYNFIQPLK